MDDQSHHNRKHKQISNTTRNKISKHLTLSELYALEQKKAKLSLHTNKNANFGPIADVKTSEPSFPYHLTLHELFEINSWKKNGKSTPAQEKPFFRSDNVYRTLYKTYKIKGLECSDERKQITKRELIPNPANKEFFIQCRNQIMGKAPEWMKSVWKKEDSQQKSEGSEIVEILERETIGDEQTDSENHCHQQNNLVDRSFCGKVGPIVQEWTEWSVKLFNDEICVIGKCNGMASISEDVLHWKRIDARTLKNCKKNIVYKLVGLPDHCIGTGFTSVIRKKFQNGFPKDWLAVLKLWSKIQHEVAGDAAEHKRWQENNYSDESDAFPSSVQQHSTLSASDREHQKMLSARVVVRKLELSQLEDLPFRIREERAGRHIQQQIELQKKRDRIRQGHFPVKVQASQHIKYTAIFRHVPDVPSSFDETDTSFC